VTSLWKEYNKRVWVLVRQRFYCTSQISNCNYWN